MSASKGDHEKQRAGRPKGASSEETYARIIASARRIFADHGYANTQNRRIAEAADVTTSTLYHYFPSKRDLYVEVFRESERALSEMYLRAAQEKGIGAQLDAIFAGSLALHETDASLLVFLAGTAREMRSHDELGKAVAQVPIGTHRTLRDMLAAAIVRKELTDETDVDAIVPLVFALTSGVSLYASFLGEQSYPRMIGALRDMVRARLARA